MASLAELMFQQASQNIRDTKSDPSAIAKSFQAGAALAQKKEQLQMQQEQIKNAQTQVKAKGVEKVLDIYKNADKFKNDADARRYIKYGVANAVEAYGVQDIFTPAMQEMMEGSREARQAAFMIESKVRSGEMSAAEGMQVLNLNGLAEYVPQVRFAEAEKFATSESGKDRRSKDQIEAARVKQQMDFQQFPVKELQKKVTADWSVFQKAGGIAYVNDKLQKIDNTIAKLSTKDKEGNPIAPKVKTGTWKIMASTSIPFTDKMDILRKTDEDLALIIDEMEGIINLKKALDSSFSDSAANRVYGRIIDPNASNELNIQRIRTEGKKLLNEAISQIKLFEENNRPVGGELYQPQNFEAEKPVKKVGIEQDVKRTFNQNHFDAATKILKGLSGDNVAKKASLIQRLQPEAERKGITPAELEIFVDQVIRGGMKGKVQ